MYQKRCNRVRNSASSRVNLRTSQNKINVLGINKSLINKGKFNKRGQVTIFIILGLVLLLTIILVISLRKEVISFKTDDLIPTTKGKVESLISACMAKIGDDALLRLGLKSGYIEVPQAIVEDTNLHLRVSPFQVVPYWAYGNRFYIPSLLQIKDDMDNYMEENLRPCVLALDPFLETYNLIEKSEIESDTQIVNNGVFYNVKWNIEVKDKSGETVTEVIDHTEQSPIKLKKVYETAREIIESEMSDLKLEDLTQDLISLGHEDLPVSGIEISCNTKSWEVNKAKQALQDLLRINIKRLKVKGTEFIEYPDQFPYYQNHYVWNLGGEFNQEEVSAVFNYDNTYPFTFQVTPTQGGKMVSGGLGGTDIISNLCIQSWKFTYDTIYPVLLKVRDETTGYNFNLAFTVHLVRNMPDRNTELKPIPASSFPANYNDKYCNEGDIPMQVLAWENIEGDDIFFDAQPLDGVDISFSCIKYSCEMGQTDYNFQKWGYQAGITANFPYCVGGILRGTKEGYKEDWVRVVTKNSEQVELNLVPIFKFPLSGVKVVKHKFNGVGQPVGVAEDLSADETALVRMKFFKALEGTNETILFHSIEQAVGGLIDEEIASRTTIDLLGKTNFNYEVQVDLFNEKELIGGFRGDWEVPWNKLENGNQIIFHTVATQGNSEDAFELFVGLANHSRFVSLPEIK